MISESVCGRRFEASARGKPMNIHICLIKPERCANLSDDIERLRDELLDLYSLYLKTRIPSVKQEVVSKAFELHLHDPEFSFII